MLCVCICGVCMHVCRVFSIIVQHAHANKRTEFVVSFMMGTRSRFGACSPVLLLDAYVAASVAQIIVTDKWRMSMFLFSRQQCLVLLSKSICTTLHTYSLTHTHVCMYA